MRLHCSFIYTHCLPPSAPSQSAGSSGSILNLHQPIRDTCKSSPVREKKGDTEILSLRVFVCSAESIPDCWLNIKYLNTSVYLKNNTSLCSKEVNHFHLLLKVCCKRVYTINCSHSSGIFLLT